MGKCRNIAKQIEIEKEKYRGYCKGTEIKLPWPNPVRGGGEMEEGPWGRVGNNR